MTYMESMVRAAGAVRPRVGTLRVRAVRPSRSIAAAAVCASLTLGLEGTAWAQCESQRLAAPSPEATARFGEALARSGDTLVVGAPGQGVDGSAFVFELVEGAWELVQELVPGDPPPAGHRKFGSSVAIEGDWLVVGAPSAFWYENPVGLAYVFQRVAGEWTPAATLGPPDGGQTYSFGETVVIEGGRIVVAEPSEYVAGVHGAVYAYAFDGSGWNLEQKVSPPTAGAFGFGSAMAMRGDVLSVGAPASGGSGMGERGSVHVYQQVAGSWQFAQTLLPPTPGPLLRFGNSVCLGEDEMLVSISGGAHWFVHEAGAWQLQAILTPADAVPLNAGVCALDGTQALVASHTQLHLFTRDPVWAEVRSMRPSQLGSNALHFPDGTWGQASLVGDEVVATQPRNSQEFDESGASFHFILVGPDADGDGAFDDCDNCDLPNADQADCDFDGLGDACAIAYGLATDCDRNGVPDSCDVQAAGDCDGNGNPDACDVQGGLDEDCDANGRPDSCDLETHDCNGNGIVDACDIASGFAADCNRDGLLDECQANMADGLYASDGGFQSSITTFVDVSQFVWFNRFTVRPQGEVINAVRVNWGDFAGPKDTEVVVWADPDQNGEPSDATPIVVVTVTPSGPSAPSAFSEYALPPTWVGEAGASFFVGVRMAIAPGDDYPATMSSHTGEDSSSWVAAADHLDRLDEHFAPLELIGGSRWMIRARTINPGLLCEPADLDADGDVDAMDLGLLLGAWGPCGDCEGCPADVDGDCWVGGGDLGVLLARWTG